MMNCDNSLLFLQDPDSRVNNVKSILRIFAYAILALLSNNLIHGPNPDVLIYGATLIIILMLYSYVTSDTTSIVSGMVLWTLLIIACYFAWKDDGLFNTAIVAFPCVLIFAFVLGGLSLLIPLTIFMVIAFYFLAYAGHSDLLVNAGQPDRSLWIKATNLSIILIVYCIGIFLVSRHITRLIDQLSIESSRNFKFQQQAELQLQKDFMTGLPNEVVCQRNMEELLRQDSLNDDIVGVITIDLKDFQRINAALGPELGDRVICILSERMQKLMDDAHSLYRLSGNEFVILVRANDYQELSNFCHQISQAVHRSIDIEDYELEISTRMGVATAPFDGTTYTVLMRRAHTALYQAKEQNETGHRFFDANMEKLTNDKLKMVHELKRAVANQEFRLFYQPKVCLSTGEIKGAEALIRWQKPDGRIISPNAFIPAAEESGLINEMGKWALETACRDCKVWHDQGKKISVAVNLSPIQFRRGNLPQTVLRALKKAQLDPNYLELEITESVFLDDAEHIQEQINEVVAHGMSIAIDDFGTGYSNLNYLTRFNASTLKVDMSFVRNMLESVQHLHIVNAVISMANVMELECVAEGVEDETTRDKLKQLGCKFGQGYLWSKPVDADAFKRFLSSN